MSVFFNCQLLKNGCQEEDTRFRSGRPSAVLLLFVAALFKHLSVSLLPNLIINIIRLIVVVNNILIQIQSRSPIFPLVIASFPSNSRIKFPIRSNGRLTSNYIPPTNHADGKSGELSLRLERHFKGASTAAESSRDINYTNLERNENYINQVPLT